MARGTATPAAVGCRQPYRSDTIPQTLGAFAEGEHFFPPGRQPKTDWSGIAMAASSSLNLPTLPEIGHPESYYARLVHRADRDNSPHCREAAKVGQYITLGIDPYLSWDQKVRYFQHALRRHCQPPKIVSDPVWMFYQAMADLVRQYCGQEALRLASQEDDRLAAAIQLGGATREEIGQEAENFFASLTGFGDTCPEHYNEVDWTQLKMIRNQWV